MGVFLGCAGHIELKRTSLDEALTGVVVRSDVNPKANRFSFDYPSGVLLSGDQVEIKTTDGGYLDFIAPSGWSASPADLPFSAPPSGGDYDNAWVSFRVYRAGSSVALVGGTTPYNNADITNGTKSLATDYPSFSSAAFDPGTSDYDNADVTPRSALGFTAPYRDGIWFVHVDEVGAIRLYRKFDDAMDGETRGRVDLVDPGHHVAISVSVINNGERVLAQVRNFELNTERDAVDVTALSDEFKRNYSGLISGNGRLTCFFDYERRRCDPMMGLDTSGELEVPIYLNQVLLRTRIGSEFWAKLVLVGRGEKPGGNTDSIDDTAWYEFDARVTNVGMAFEPTGPIETTVDFVATGPIRLRVKQISNYLMQENDDRIRLEENQISGYLEVEQED